jgi:hypothetical protein
MVSFNGFRVNAVVRLILVAQTLAFVWAGLALAGEPMLPFKLKPLYLDTILVDHGKPNAVIVVPDDAAYGKPAEQVRQAVTKATGIELTIRRASEMASSFGELLGPAPDRNLILIAGPNSNNVVTILIHSAYCTLDTEYPGKGGSIVRTIHNPWGNGVNAILLGGSDMRGVQDAVGRFCAKLPKGDTLTIPRTMDVVFPKGTSQSTDPTDAEIKAELKQQTINLEGGQQSGFFGPIVQAGWAYAKTGKEGQAKLYRELFFLADDLRRSSPDPANWGGATDFLFGGLIDTWDNVEESPSLSDADRERITRIILDYSRFYAAYNTTKGMEVQVLRNNHNTFTCIGVLKAGLYFSKYYNLPEAQQWIRTGDLCFAPEIKSFKTQEDCAGYGWINTRHVCNYCLARADFSWFTSGKADQAGDLWIMTTDNLGHQATFGDVGGFQGNGQAALWNTLVDVERKGRYAWALRKVEASSEPGNSVHGVEPVEPTDLLGLQCRVTEPMFYKQFNGKGTVPQERTFDKITMRASFDPDKAYLLLDGINGAYHGHWDANSILRFTDRGRIWLADCDYIKSLPRYHNSMLVLRDGQSAKMPPFVERELAADLGKTGFTCTTMHDYAGTDWRRNILWDKDGAFVFIDEVTATSPQPSPERRGGLVEFSARCLWQTLGAPKLTGNLFQVSQKGPTFSILNLDGARLRYSDDAELGANWAGYSFADPVVHTLQQVQTQRLRAGERICFVNVLSTSKDSEAPKAQRVSETSALVGEGDDQALVGVQSGDDFLLPGLRTDAQVYWISPRRIALGNLTNLYINRKVVLRSAARFSVEIDLKGNATLLMPQKGSVTIGANTREFDAGNHTLTGVALPEFKVTLPKPVPAPSQTIGPPAGPRKLVEAAKPEAGARILSLAADASGVYVGRADGHLQALSADAKPRWEFDAHNAVGSILVGRLAKNDPARIAVGTVKGNIFLLDESGNKLWDRQLPFFKVDPAIGYFTSAGLAGDGNRALIVGSNNWHHYAYDSAGNQLWSYNSVRGSTAGTATDLDGDGKQEPVIGTEYNQVHALNPDGTARWHVIKVGGPRISAVLSCKLADNKPGVVFGGAEGTAYAYDADGKQSWNYGTGDEITCMELAEVGGGGSEIIIGSRSFSVSAIDTAGKRLWWIDVGEPILCMALADLDGDGAREIGIGTEDGHVIVLSLKGEVLASWTTQGPVHKLAALPGSPDRLAAACEDGRLVLLKME